MLLVGTRQVPLSVRGAVSFDGAGTDGPAVLMSLPAAQATVGQPGRVNTVLVSNAGDASSGVEHTDAVVALLEPALEPVGLQANPAKEDGLAAADARGEEFLGLFTTFGMFSILAGILLIFLIFVTLATERRGEMGVARAIGTQRGHLVKTFLFEGAVYDLAAAAVGVVLGIGVSYAMVTLTSAALTRGELDLQWGVQPRSVVIAYALGVLLTLVVVTASAWRVSRLNIVSAIRDLPEPRRRGRRSRWLEIAVLAVAGAFLTWSGVGSHRVSPFMIGVSLLVVAAARAARALGVAARTAYTVAGLALVAWSFLPFRISLAPLGSSPGMDFSMWVIDGVIVVLGATWVVVLNADVLLDGLSRFAAHARSLAPIVKLAVTYPLRSRFRTGTTLAMFTLVVFTLVSGTTIYTAFIDAFDDVDQFGGGFDVRAVTAPAGAVDDVDAALAAHPDLQRDVDLVAAESYVPVEARQADLEGAFEAYPLRGLDAAFLGNTTYELATTAERYESDRQVWDALAEEPGLAVVDSMVVPRQADWTGTIPPDFGLSGFNIEDEHFTPVPVDVRDPQTGTELHVTVIGVLTDSVPWEMAGISVSQDLLAPLGDRARPTVQYVRAAPGADPADVAEGMEAAFFANGLEAETFDEILDEAVGASNTLNRLMQGFIGLGLVVGVAALGVISARAVVERRQQLGVLRAIGFQPAMIRRSLLLEASFVSLTAIVLGTALALGLSYNVIAYSADQPVWENVRLTVPWRDLAVVFVGVYLAALATSLLPAVRASRVYPAEALRYQ